MVYVPTKLNKEATSTIFLTLHRFPISWNKVLFSSLFRSCEGWLSVLDFRELLAILWKISSKQEAREANIKMIIHQRATHRRQDLASPLPLPLTSTKVPFLCPFQCEIHILAIPLYFHGHFSGPKWVLYGFHVGIWVLCGLCVSLNGQHIHFFQSMHIA